MHTFNDAAGRSWTIHLTLGSAMLVKDKLGIDLLQPETSQAEDGVPLITRLGTDEMLLGEVICCLLEYQFETHKVTANDVRQAFDGKTLLNAQKAFYEELVDFFQGRGRSDRAKAVSTQRELIDAAIKAATSRIEAVDVEETVRGAMSGNSPGLSGSTPDP